MHENMFRLLLRLLNHCHIHQVLTFIVTLITMCLADYIDVQVQIHCKCARVSFFTCTSLQKCRYLNVVKMVVVSCSTVVDITIVRPDLKYQLGFTVQDGVVSQGYVILCTDSEHFITTLVAHKAQVK